MKTRLSLHLRQNTRRGERLARAHGAASAALAASIREPGESRATTRERKRAGRLFPPTPGPVATPAGAEPSQRSVTLAAHELHALLRAALPPLRDGRARKATAKLLDAISELAAYLHAHRAGADDADLLAAAELVTLRIERWKLSTRPPEAAREFPYRRVCGRPRHQFSLCPTPQPPRPPMRAAPRAATPDPQLRALLLAIAAAAIAALDALDPEADREPEPAEDDDERDLVTA